MAAIDDLRNLGYTIIEVQPPGNYAVTGPQVSTYIKLSDTAAWQSLLDTHSARVNPQPLPPTTQDLNYASLRDRASQALTANATFLAVSNPTTAQVAAQTKTLTKECDALIRLVIGQLDDITGT